MEVLYSVLKTFTFFTPVHHLKSECCTAFALIRRVRSDRQNSIDSALSDYYCRSLPIDVLSDDCFSLDQRSSPVFFSIDRTDVHPSSRKAPMRGELFVIKANEILHL